MITLKILALLAGWIFFYKILKSRNKSLAGLKATIITLLFASLLFRMGTELYAFVSKAYFSLDKQGETVLNASPLIVPADQNSTYCNQFTDQDKNKITKISEKNGDRYCGEFWGFEKNKTIIVPYKIQSNEVIYWASPFLRIYVPKTMLKKPNVEHNQ
jgi:hypothetical protein